MEKRILSKEEVYGQDMTLIDDKYIYYSDNTCIGIFADYERIEYYNIENPYSIDIPKYRWVKRLTMIEYSNGDKKWYLNGRLHREDGPAIEWVDGCKEWYLNGKLHREDGPAVEWPINANKIINGVKKWYLNDKLHREDGPAVEWANGDKKWYLNDKLHREDGPAVELANGDKEWRLDGKKYIKFRYYFKLWKIKRNKKRNENK